MADKEVAHEWTETEHLRDSLAELRDDVDKAMDILQNIRNGSRTINDLDIVMDIFRQEIDHDGALWHHRENPKSNPPTPPAHGAS